MVPFQQPSYPTAGHPNTPQEPWLRAFPANCASNPPMALNHRTPGGSIPDSESSSCFRVMRITPDQNLLLLGF
jgi:hypothetical protein